MKNKHGKKSASIAKERLACVGAIRITKQKTALTSVVFVSNYYIKPMHQITPSAVKVTRVSIVIP